MVLGLPVHFSNTLQSRCSRRCDSVTNPPVPPFECFCSFRQFTVEPQRVFKQPHKTTANYPPPQRLLPVVKVLSDDQMLEVVVDGPLVVLQQRVGVSQAVAGLRLHRPVLQEPGQLQSSPGGRKRQRVGGKLKECLGWVGARGRAAG